MNCAQPGCTTEPIDLTVETWAQGSDTMIRVDVPVCGGHHRCPVCEIIMEVNPLSGMVECFVHPL